MPKHTYTQEDKQYARRLLLIHSGDVGVVHGLTDIPRRTLYHWRNAWDDNYDVFFDAFAQKVIAYANAKQRQQNQPQPLTDNDSDLAQPDNSFAQFVQLRAKLMEHVMTLANNLLLGDHHISQRTLALCRLLDRIAQLDDIIPDANPEKVVRFEFVSDGKITSVPPWANHDDNMLSDTATTATMNSEPNHEEDDPIFAYNPVPDTETPQPTQWDDKENGEKYP